MTLHLYEPPAAMVDWDAFSDCIISTRWSSVAELEKDLGLSHNLAWRAFNGKTIGLLPFLRICKRMGINAEKFVVER